MSAENTSLLVKGLKTHGIIRLTNMRMISEFRVKNNADSEEEPPLNAAAFTGERMAGDVRSVGVVSDDKNNSNKHMLVEENSNRVETTTASDETSSKSPSAYRP